MKKVRIIKKNEKYNGHSIFDVYGRGDDNDIAGQLLFNDAGNGILDDGYTFQAYYTYKYSLTPETLEQIVAKIRFLNSAVEAGIL